MAGTGNESVDTTAATASVAAGKKAPPTAPAAVAAGLTAAQASNSAKKNDDGSNISRNNNSTVAASSANNTTVRDDASAAAAAAGSNVAAAANTATPLLIAPGPARIHPPWSVFPLESWTLLSLVHDPDWKANYHTLAQFRAVHGHVVVQHVAHHPPDNTTSHTTTLQLVEWLHQQQLLYNDFLKQFEGKDFKSTDIVRVMFAKIELLRMLGFPFVRDPVTTAAAAAASVAPESMENNKNDESNNGDKKNNLKNKNKRKATWDTQLLALRDFRDEHGHCDPKESTLQNWVARQRKRLKGEEKAAAPLEEEEVRRLEDIGIATLTKKKIAKISSSIDHTEGDTPKESVPKNLTDPERFDQMYEELKKFREEHGHTVVSGMKDGKLHQFSAQLRREYKKIKSGQTSKFLTPIRIERLKQIDFSFEVGVKYTWDQRFEQWLEYRSQNNGKNPSTSTTLGKWVSKTRIRYHDTMERRKVAYSNDSTHYLTDEQIEKLKRHAFDVGEREHPRTVKTWEERFDDLLAYNEEFGDVSVPQVRAGTRERGIRVATVC